MKDLISRQAAIDAVYKCTDTYVNNLPVMIDKADAYKALADLPSAQPEIIRCKDCGCWEIEPVCSAYPNLHFCRNWMQRIATEAEDFCSRAERRQE